MELWEIHQFPQGGMLKFTYKGRFFTIKIAYEKLLDWKFKWRKHALVPLLHVDFFCFWKILNSWFLVVFQSFVFGQILAILGRFCCIGNGLQHHAQTSAEILTPKGLWVPYMEFWDFGQAAMNAINFWIFWKLFVKMCLTISYAGV
jgi:hypothetical protein